MLTQKQKKIIRTAGIISLILAVLYTVCLALLWESIPDQVPTHFDASGTADDYGSRNSLLLEPILSFLLILLISIAGHFPSAWNFPVKVTERNREKLYDIGAWLLAAAEILAVLILLTAGAMSITSVPGFVIWIPTAVLFIVMAAAIIRMLQCREKPSDRNET